MLRSIADIWDLASGVAEDNEERSFTAAFHQDTQVGAVYKDFISDEPTRASSSRRWRSSEEFMTTAKLERADRRKNCEIQRSELGESVYAEQTSQSRLLRAEHEGRLPEELGPWVGLPEGAAHVNEESGVCNEEG